MKSLAKFQKRSSNVRGKIIRRMGRLGVTAAAIIALAALLMSLNPIRITVDAASLKHIEEIVAASGAFNILELVPDTAAASIGYYVAGQEPISAPAYATFSYIDDTGQTVVTNGWKAALSRKTSPEERRAYINGLFGALKDSGVLSGGTATPLRLTYGDAASGVYYDESYTAPGEQGWSKLRLAEPETGEVTGAFTPASDGAYRASFDYTPSESGFYIQNIAYFEYTEAPVFGTGTYFYLPVFIPIAAGMDLTGWDDVAVYTQDEQGNYILNKADNKITVGDYLKSGGFDAAVTYYYVDPAQTGAPGEYNYAAVVSASDVDDSPEDGFTSPPEGSPAYFIRSISGFTYVETGGNYAYTPDGAETYTVTYTDVYYRAGFENNQLFKRNVFDLSDARLDALNVTVTVREAGAVTAADIQGADMIYISAGADLAHSGVTAAYGGTADLPDARAADILNFAANLNPVMIDYALIRDITAATDQSVLLNVQKLGMLCLQAEIPSTTQPTLGGLEVDWPALAALTGDADKTFVNGNIYCFDTFNTADPSAPDNVVSAVTPLFNEPYSEEVYSDGFIPVLEEIRNENFLRSIAGQTDLLNENVTMATTIRHIINFRGQRETNEKTSIRVLDLEPAKVTSATWLTAATVCGWIGNALEENQIEIVHMTTGEFIGKIEDINETYDMIYIGMSTESLNTAGGSTVYNDADMNGLIYTGIGDEYRAAIEMAGIRTGDYITHNGIKAINNTTGTKANLFRFSGNDITKTSVTKLQKFAQAGYPIILADDFVSGASINTDKVDSSSYMYQAVSSIYGAYPNVMTGSYAGVNTATVVKYLNVSKPRLILDAKPVEYDDDPNTTLIPNPDDGYYYLDYVFSIENETDPTPLTTTYDCRLYIDLNADGRYSAGERLDDIEIRRADGGALVLPLSSESGEYYALSADTKYRVTRQMPDDYVGIIPWKLECIKNGADQIHASASGFTRIAAGSNTQTIRVLQIMQAGTSSTKLNLAWQLQKDKSGNYNGIYGRLIAELKDFDVYIDAIENDELEAIGSASAIESYLSGYNMLIIGFNDCYDGIAEKSAAAIVSYIGSGKSVLFTHDTTSLTQVPSSNFPMATGTSARTLYPTDVIYNTDASVFRSIDGRINWSGDYTETPPVSVKPSGAAETVYVVLVDVMPSSSGEQDYYNARIPGCVYSADASGFGAVTEPASFSAFKAMTGTSTVLYFDCITIGGWYGTGAAAGKCNVTVTGDFVKFAGGVKYACTGLTYNVKTAAARPESCQELGTDSDDNRSSWTIFCLYNDPAPEFYTVAGTYNAASNSYKIGGMTLYPARSNAPFPQSTLFTSKSPTVNIGTLPNNIMDWGYYFNTVIRDAVGLDRYGITNPSLKKLVDIGTSMPPENVASVLAMNRSVAFAPKSGRSATVQEFHGYTNYALIRFGGTNTYKYTNNNYGNRETTNVSQVNKGQITTYPYNVNTAAFGGRDPTITGYGGSYMRIGSTHEQYFQINMNTDDIVVWYCMSNYSSYNPKTGVFTYDGSSYYDDVPNDCVNAYYIYNKGNVTYSGVGHSSNADLYTGTVGQEFINEAKLFVNTMIAAFQSGEQAPSVKIKKDARGTADLKQKFLLVDEGNPALSGDSAVLTSVRGPTDEERAVYFKISDPNIGVSKTISVSYYVADPGGSMTGIDPTDSNRTVSPLLSTPTYNSNGTAVSALKGGYVYKLYLPDSDGPVPVLDQLKDENTASVRLYIKVTTTIGSAVLSSTDYLDLRKQQLFQLA